MKNRKLLMIPGPIEFEPEVLRAMGEATTSHVAPNFIECHGNVLDMMQKVWQAPSGQPFVIAGSGTLAMDSAAANLIEPGDNALVISTGYFGDRYENILKTYGAEVTKIEANIGERISLLEIENELKSKKYKLLTFTHVDTSTGVLNNPKEIGTLGAKYNVLTILDGVCSLAAEEIKQEEWHIDIALTASQKAIGVPPGLALFVVSQKAMNVWRNRKYGVQNYYADWSNWLPIMEAYQNRKPSYFGTPAVNLIRALEVSLQSILKEGVNQRFERHKNLAKKFRTAMDKLGLKLVPTNNDWAANALTAIYYPKEIDGNSFRTAISKQGIIVAGGLLGKIKTKYFRVGHMGAVNQSDLIATVAAIENALKETGYVFNKGVGIKEIL